jgi:hypothetical protein
LAGALALFDFDFGLPPALTRFPLFFLRRAWIRFPGLAEAGLAFGFFAGTALAAPAFAVAAFVFFAAAVVELDFALASDFLAVLDFTSADDLAVVFDCDLALLGAFTLVVDIPADLDFDADLLLLGFSLFPFFLTWESSTPIQKWPGITPLPLRITTP